MPWEVWTRIGVVSGSLIALGTIIGWLYRKVVWPMWKRTALSLRRLNRGMDDLLGRPAELDFEGNVAVPEVTSLRSEIVKLRAELAGVKAEVLVIRADVDTHVKWHPSPDGRPAAGPVPKRRRNGQGTS